MNHEHLEKLSKEDIEKYITDLENELKNTKKYGLVWDKEDTPEECINKCLIDIPVLTHKRELDIKGNKFINNLLIEGDNFYALSALKIAGLKNIDVIYIDPPYNTGNKDFTYNDSFVDSEDGYRHSKWLNFMSKRLKIARELLSEDGLIFISIDDNEQANLKILCDSIFGEHNFITQFIWEKTQHFGRQKVNFYSNCEYVLCYAKKLFSSELGKLKELLVEKIKTDLTDAPLYNASNKLNELVFPKGKVKFNLKDGVYTETDNSSYELMEPVTIKNSVNITDLKLKFKSRWSQATINEEIAKGTTFWIKSKGFAIRAIYHEGKTAKESPRQIIFTNNNNSLCTFNRFGDKVGVNEEGSNELNKLVKQNIFSYPKPTSLIKYLLSLIFDYKEGVHKKDFIVFDFFAGSGTTAQAVIELNKEDNGTRKFIVCTNNENNICSDVCYPRIKKVLETADGSKFIENLRYFKIDFVKDEKNRDQAKYSLVEKCNGLLCILEDCYDLVESHDAWYEYSSPEKELFIFNDFYSSEAFENMKSKIKQLNKICIVYVFSTDENLDFVDLTGIENVTIKPIPTKIYEIYKEIVEDIKRGE